MKRKRTLGFTLVELIVTMALIGVIALIAVPSVTAAIREAKLARYDEHAKTIFLAAQTRLTNMKYSGELDALNAANDANKLTGAEVPAIQNLSKPDDSDVRYMKFDLNSASESDGLYQILNRQLNDDTVLSAAVLVEYSAATGRVYSVFYSEEAAGFYYGTAAGGVDISDRTDMDALKANGKFGYYGVDDLNVVIPNAVIGLKNVELVNGERLYLTWELDDSSGTANDANAAFTISLNSKDGTARYSFTVNAADMGEPMLGVPIQRLSDYDEDISTTSSGGSANMKHCLYKEGLKYYLVLDAYDIGDPGTEDTYSILDRYPDIPTGEMYCEISAEDLTVPGSATTATMSNVQHTLFTYEDPATGSPVTMAADTYGITYPRHLYNIRYMAASTNYRQLGDVDFASSEAGGYITDCGNYHATADISVPVFPSNSVEYTGAYNGESHDIIGAKIGRTAGQYAGLFGQVGQAGSITDLRLNSCEVGKQSNYTGVSATGGIVGVNKGALTNVSLMDTSVYGGEVTGGIVGDNAQTGNVSGCSTAVTDITDPNAACVHGTGYTGGIAGTVESKNSKFGTLINCTNGMAVEGSGAHTGGVVGSMDRDNGNGKMTLSNCANTGRVKSTCTQQKDSYAGGITGYCRANLTIKDCTNSGDVSGSAFYAGGITGHLLGDIEDCDAAGGTVSSTRGEGYVGGVAAYMGGTKSSITYTAAFPRTNGMVKLRTNVIGAGYKQHVGGFVGRFEPDVIQNKSRTVSKLDFAAVASYTVTSPESYIGGIAGRLPTIMTIDDCTLTGEVNGLTGYVGGIVGVNYGTVKNIDIAFAATPVKVTSDPQRGSQGTGGVIGMHQGGDDNTNNLHVGTDDGPGLKAPVISGYQNVGGVIGRVLYNSLYPRNFKDLGAYANVTGTVNVGGVVGFFTNAKYLHLVGFVNYGTVTGRTSAATAVGGCVGRLGAQSVSNNTSYTVTECVNLGSVYNEGTASGTGGIVGLIAGTANSTDAIQVTKCENKGSVEGNSHSVGGICGEITAGKVKFDNCTVRTDPAYAAYGAVAEVRGHQDRVGGIVGYASGDLTTILNCTVDCAIYCDNAAWAFNAERVGGIVGGANTRLVIDNCTVGEDAVITAEEFGGGILGANDNSTKYISGTQHTVEITDCTTAAGSELRCGLEWLGGIVGMAGKDAYISNCTNSMAFTGRSVSHIGGIAGAMDSGSAIVDCKNYSDIAIGVSDVGGIAGGVTASAAAQCSITYCGNYGALTASGSRAGGIAGSFIGAAGSTLSNCVNYGYVECSSTGNAESYGGILGMGSGGLTLSGDVNFAQVSSRNAATALNNTGGIAGSIDGGGATLTNCVNVGSIVLRNSDAGNIGGIAGYNAGGTITYCVFHKTAQPSINTTLVNEVTAAATLAGDLFTRVPTAAVTINSGELDLSAVSTAVNIGGIVGHTLAYGGTASSVRNCSSNADIRAYGTIGSSSSTVGLGGIAGHNEGALNTCSYSGMIMVDPADDYANVGGIIGYHAAAGGNTTDCTFTGNIQGLSATSAMRTYRGGIIGFAEADSSTAAAVLAGCTYNRSGVPPRSITGGVQEPGLAVGNWDGCTDGITGNDNWTSAAPTRQTTPTIMVVRTNVAGDITETPTFQINWGDAALGNAYDVEIVMTDASGDTPLYTATNTPEVDYDTGTLVLEECEIVVRVVCKGDGSALIDSAPAEETIIVPARLAAPTDIKIGAVVASDGTMSYQLSWTNGTSAAVTNCADVSIYRVEAGPAYTLIGTAVTAGILPEEMSFTPSTDDIAAGKLTVCAVAEGIEGQAETSLVGTEYVLLLTSITTPAATVLNDAGFEAQNYILDWTGASDYANGSAQYKVEVIYGYGTPQKETVLTHTIDTNSYTFTLPANTTNNVYLLGQTVTVWVTLVNPGTVTPVFCALQITLPTTGGGGGTP